MDGVVVVYLVLLVGWLVAVGVVRGVRNPIAVGTATTVVGLALVVPNVLAGAMVGLVVLSLQVQVQVGLVEEPYLERVHGHAYVSYAARTGRFVPGIGKRPPPTPAPAR
jgi:protein-S-isoprenylcysteine O-methyltransferase Ste14